MDKSKLNWVYYIGELFDVHVTPNLIKRLHAPLEPDLEYVTSMQGRCLHLRPCAVGLNKEGLITAWLYSTNSGRFFDRGKSGWVEHKFSYSPAMHNYKAGSKQPIMRQFGNLLCHLLVAHAWHGARPEGMVCDHKDTNLMNWHAVNLEWVTPAENNRRAGIARKLRKIGINPELIYTNILDRIFKLPDELIGTLIDMFLFLSKTDFGDQELSVTNLNACLAEAYRRTDIACKLRKIGVDPEQLTTKLLDDIYKLPDCHIGTLTGKFLMLRHVEFDDQDLDARTLNMCVIAALVHTKKMSQII